MSAYREFNHTTNKFDKYLVLYDAIPGGTGYLEKLFSAKEFSSLLYNAYKEIKNCHCQLEGKDGCYRCIYSYSNQFFQLELSREKAEKRFESIVKRSEDWEPHPNGLGNLTNQGNIEESELEERFIRSLKKLAALKEEWKVSDVNDDGTISYDLEYKDQNVQYSYRIRPQVNLGKNDGVEFHTRADFLLICTSFVVDNEAVEDMYSIPRIAVYLDGFQYHASSEHNRFQNDYQKRQSIANSDSHCSWTLTWSDIELFDTGMEEEKIVLSDDTLSNELTKKYAETKSKILNTTRRDHHFLTQYENNFSRLLNVLGKLNDRTVLKRETALYLSFFQPKLFHPSYAPDNLKDAFEGTIQDNYCIRNKTLNGLVMASPYTKNELYAASIAVNLETNSVVYKLTTQDTTSIDQTQWNNFWILFNLLQFSEVYQNEETIETPTVLNDDQLSLRELLEQFDVSFHGLLTSLHKAGEIVTEHDEIKLYALLNKQGDVIAEADFIIHSKQLVVNPFSEHDKSVFEKNGFTIIGVKELKEIKI